MHLPVPSSLLGVVVMLVVFGGAGLTYILRRKRLSPTGEPTDLAALGFLPGEGVRSHGIGKILFIDERDMLGNPAANMFECGGTTLVTSRVTSSDRLLVEVNGQRMWFDATARPVIRRIGRIMQQDTTGVLDILANQTETTVWFIRDGKQSPPGAAPKKQYNAQSVMEDVYVLELIAPCRPALRFEAVESVVVALTQWAQAPVKATMQIPVHVPAPARAPMLAAPQYIPPQAQQQQQAQQAQQAQPHPAHGQTLHMYPVQRAPSQPPQHAAPVAYGHHSSHPPHYAAAPMHGHHSSHPPHYAAPVAQQAPGHHSSHPPQYAAPVAPASQARHSVAPSPHAVIRRRSQPPSRAAQAMPSSGSQPLAPIAPIVPQLASYVPPQPASYAPPATPRARLLPPPLPQYYVQRYQPTLQSPQFAPGSY